MVIVGEPSTLKPPPKKPITTSPTTTSSTTTTTQASTNEYYPAEVDQSTSCSEQFSPHPDCNKYYLCNNGHPIEQSCAYGLHWNRETNVCDWPRNANCQESIVAAYDPNRPTTSPRPTTTTTRKPRPPRPTDFVPTETDDGKFKVVCYFTKYVSIYLWFISAKIYIIFNVNIFFLLHFLVGHGIDQEKANSFQNILTKIYAHI